MAWYVQMDSRNRGDEDETYLSPAIDIIPEEHERFDAIGKALSKEIIQEYRAQGFGAYDDALMIKNPYHPYFYPSPVPSLMQGWRWPIPDAPFCDRLKGKEGRLVDIVGTSFGTYAVSQKVIDIIESIEPGVHQYLPYGLVQKDGSLHSDKRWLLNVCTRAETLDYKRSNLVPIQKAPHWLGDRGGKKHLVVRKEAVAGRALWYEYRYKQNRGKFMLSDRLWDALNAAGCAGWRPIFGALGDHIEEV